MPIDRSSLLLTRRHALWIAGSGIASWGRLFATTGDFWDKKDPSQWDAEEIEKLLHKSPWAKDVNAQAVPGEGGYGRTGTGGGGGGGGYPGGGYPGGPRVGMGIPGIGGIGGRPRGGMGGGRGRGGGTSSYEKGTVRWESAQPILQAQKLTLPEAFANHYVIAVSGIPLRTRNQRSAQTSDDDRDSTARDQKDDDTLDNLKQFATLEPKGKEIVQAGVVQRGTGAYSTFWFGFSREMLPLSKDDKEVTFQARLGSLAVKAKFDLKEMTYHKKLAV